MARAGKWLQDTHPRQPVSNVARRAVRDRLKMVWHYAPLAAKQHTEDLEYVHQLRVSTRRARAALQIFADVLPAREARWWKKRLRGLRQAAGEARDLDVLGGRLAKLAKAKRSRGLKAVVTQITARRAQAQEPLVRRYKSAKRKGFKARSRELVKQIHWRRDQPEPAFGEAAQTKLRPLVEEFFAAAAGDLSDVETLHQMRIRGKQVRYAMELLAGAFDPSFRQDLYPVFEEVQEKLGTINDIATAITTFTDWFERTDSKRGRAALSKLIASEEKQLDKTCQRFCRWWSVQRADELRQRFEIALSEPAAIATTSNTSGARVKSTRHNAAVTSD